MVSLRLNSVACSSQRKNGQEDENKNIDWKQWLFHWKQLLSEFISIAEDFIWRVAVWLFVWYRLLQCVYSKVTDWGRICSLDLDIKLWTLNWEMDKKRTKRTYGGLIIGQKQETTQYFSETLNWEMDKTTKRTQAGLNTWEKQKTTANNF